MSCRSERSIGKPPSGLGNCCAPHATTTRGRKFNNWSSHEIS
jgi:hypothetical protein